MLATCCIGGRTVPPYVDVPRRERRGLGEVLRAPGPWLRHQVAKRLMLYRRRLRGPHEFTFRGRQHRYFFHRRNRTWTNERCVEVPIIRQALDDAPDARVLEIGRVLPQYFRTDHEVVDKYNRHGDVAKVDAVDFRSPTRYDLIVSISTLEHVGWDEVPKDPSRAIPAVANLLEHLTDDGMLVATIPLGYNPEFERMVEEGQLTFSEVTCLKRVSADNEWAEVAWSDVRDVKYAAPYPGANALMVVRARRGDLARPDM